MATKENLDEYTVDELKEIARDEDAELHGATTKADIIKAIQKGRKSDTKTGVRGGNKPGDEEPEAIKNQRERFEATNFGPEPLPADDPRRAPRPEDVDHAAEAERLEQNDRAFHIHQGDKVEKTETVKH